MDKTFFLGKDDANWKLIPRLYFDRCGENALLFKMNTGSIKLLSKQHGITDFYLDLPIAWYKTQSDTRVKKHFREIKQQVIWGNKYITLNGKAVYFKTLV